MRPTTSRPRTARAGPSLGALPENAVAFSMTSPVQRKAEPGLWVGKTAQRETD